MKAIIFDTGPIISLSLNNLLWILPELKKHYDGKFYVTPSVVTEAAEVPLRSKKYKFEAIQVLKLISDGVLEVYKDIGLTAQTKSLLDLANSLFIAHDSFIKNVHFSEVEVIVADRMIDADSVVIDEFITRMLLEDPYKVRDRMENKLHLPVKVHDENVAKFRQAVKDVKVIRSLELVTVAYEKGILDKYSSIGVENPRKELLDAVLWGIKLNGCSMTYKEIEDVMRIEGF